MPIYGYRCAACGHQKDILQKMSDSPLTVCPSCGEAAFTKEVSAPAFQLKGTGWYVTDFRDGNKKPDAAKDAKGGESKSDGEPKSGDAAKEASSSSDAKSADSKPSDTKASDKSSSGDKKATPAPAPAPAAKD